MSASSPLGGSVTLQDIAEAAFAECRALGHAWRHKGRVSDADEDGTKLLSRPSVFGMVGFRSQCPNCGTERIKWMSRTGALDKSAEYRYPNGYQQHGDDKLAPHEWRRDFVISTFGSDMKVERR